jgi:hypothetical protein
LRPPPKSYKWIDFSGNPTNHELAFRVVAFLL